VRLPQLRSVKIQVLEIVWAYLYSGSKKEAWRALADMWPNGDVERIRSQIIAARARGMHVQLDGASKGVAQLAKTLSWFMIRPTNLPTHQGSILSTIRGHQRTALEGKSTGEFGSRFCRRTNRADAVR
jgi:hypothetical protein